MHRRLLQKIWTVVKIAIALAILVYLIITGREAFARLAEQKVEWWLLVAALAATLAMATLSFVRWHLLIVALGIDMRLIDTLRLGALGFVLNFVSPGSIGGDFFKAIFLAHRQPKHRPEAIASIVADRVVGLLTMMVLASTGILVSGLLSASSPTLRLLCQSILLLTALIWAGAVLLLSVRALTGEWIRQQARRLPLTGRTIIRLLDTVEIYRRQKRMLAAAFAVSLAMALCYITSFYLVARGLPMKEPSWEQHLVIVPVAGLVSTLPVAFNGFGTTEYAVEELYRAMPGAAEREKGDGTLVSLARRVTDVAVALVGLVFYFSNRREVRDVFAKAERVAKTETKGPLENAVGGLSEADGRLPG